MTNMKQIADEVLDRLLAMPEDEFNSLIESHKNGDIATAFRELTEFKKHMESCYNSLVATKEF